MLSSQRAQPSEHKPHSLPRLGAMALVEVLQSPELLALLRRFVGDAQVAKLHSLTSQADVLALREVCYQILRWRRHYCP